MKEITEYVKHVMYVLDSENFFEKAGLFMDRKILKKFLTETITRNYEETGSCLLMEGQLEYLIDKTNKYIISETFEDLLKDDLIEVKGMDDNGEFLYGPKEI
jgi:hypothetical protein